jgi:predicted kinase
MVTLTVTFGMPGSGKSTWSTEYARATGARLFSTDPIRTENRNVVAYLNAMKAQVDMALAAGDDVIVDACNVQAGQRRAWLNIGRRRGARCVLAVIDTDPAEAMRRNLERPEGQQVPRTRMADYAARVPRARRTLYGEGWDLVDHVAAGEVPEVIGTSRDW